jgi:hypothetical protein
MRKEKTETSIKEKTEEPKPEINFEKKLLVTKPNEPLNIFATVDMKNIKGTPTYTWSVEGANIEQSNKRFTTFTGDIGTYLVSLQILVAQVSIEEVVTVKVTKENVSPLIQLDKQQDFVIFKRCSSLLSIFDEKCEEKQIFHLSANGSYDPDGDDLSYQWKLKKKPENSKLEEQDIKNSQSAFASSKISGTHYYLFFAFCMFITALGFIPYARSYKGRTYIQDDESIV